MRRQVERPDKPLQLDVKTLGRFRLPECPMTKDRQRGSKDAGWDYVHVAIDDRSRAAFAGIHPGKTGRSACQALLQAPRYCHDFGIHFTRIMTDNGAC